MSSARVPATVPVSSTLVEGRRLYTALLPCGTRLSFNLVRRGPEAPLRLALTHTNRRAISKLRELASRADNRHDYDADWLAAAGMRHVRDLPEAAPEDAPAPNTATEVTTDTVGGRMLVSSDGKSFLTESGEWTETISEAKLFEHIPDHPILFSFPASGDTYSWRPVTGRRTIRIDVTWELADAPDEPAAEPTPTAEFLGKDADEGQYFQLRGGDRAGQVVKVSDDGARIYPVCSRGRVASSAVEYLYTGSVDAALASMGYTRS